MAAVFCPGDAMVAGGNETGEVEALGEGGGNGAEGSCTAAVEGVGTEAEIVGTCEVASRGCVEPAVGRARRVMRTVSFFKGTAEVLLPLAKMS